MKTISIFSRSVLLQASTALILLTFSGSIAVAQAFPQDPPCPTNDLAPFGVNDPNNRCKGDSNGGKNCLLIFKGYQWWANYHYVGNWFNQYYYNGGLGTAFAPQNVSLQSDGLLHLKIQKVDLGGGLTWTGADTSLLLDASGKEVNTQYGDYLVTIKLLTAKNWNELDPNVAVGAFTYERYGKPNETHWPGRGSPYNPYREIDLAEISRFGKPSDKTGAQFAMQKWDYDEKTKEISVFRYDIGSNSVVTLVMRWRHKSVVLEKYDGDFTLDNLPQPTEIEWKSKNEAPSDLKTAVPDSLRNFIPCIGSDCAAPHGWCDRFHINFWLGNFGSTPHKGPTNDMPQEIVITNFQYRP